MNPNVGMPNMNPMAGAVGGAPMSMMNNGAVNPQAMAAAVAANNGGRPGLNPDDNKRVLNTYIYEYFIRYGMHDCARALLNSEAQINVHKDGAKRRRDENGNLINGMDDAMETDSKDDIDSKLPDDLPQPALPMTSSETSFLLEWFALFFDMMHAQRQKSGNGHVNQYVAHTQQQSRLKQNQQQEMFRNMPQYQQLMRNNMNQMGMMKPGSNQLARTAIANNQNNPQMQMMQGKQNPMQRDPSGMDANRDRPSSPASGENAPSPSKRQRVEGGAPFNPQPGMMPNGRPGQGVPPQIAANPQAAAAHQMLAANGINPSSLNAQQFQDFVNSNPSAQQKSIATYAQNLQAQQQHQMRNKQMPNAGPPGQGSPMMNGPDGSALQFAYNANEIGGPGGIRPGPNGQQAAGSNHALQDYQMQLMLLEQQNKKRLMMARQEQDGMGPMGRDGQPPGAPGQQATGPNGQPFPESSPQAMRSGTSPNPTEQMKRGTPQMNNSGIPSPIPEGGQSRGSPNPMNFMAGGDPNMGPGFNMNAQGQMAGMRPPSSHPGQPGFNGQMNPQAMMAARQQAAQAGQANPQQWQQGPNGQLIPMQPGGQPVQGTPQQQNRAMPPPSAPVAAANNANRTTASPQQAAAAPPTPNQGNKAGPKKKESKAGNKKGGKKGANAAANANANATATPAGDNNNDGAEAPAPATPITPANGGNFKNGQNGAPAPNGNAPAQPAAATNGGQPGGLDPNADGGMGLDNIGMFGVGSMEFTNPLQSNDVLNDFDFDSFLHDDGPNEQFDFNAFGALEGGEIGAD